MKSGKQGEHTEGVNQFLFCLDAFFYGMGQLIQCPKLDSQILDEFRYHMNQAMVALERQATAQKIAADLIGHVQYALVAFVDEWVIHRTGMSHDWVTCPLQLEYFGENTAGERFFYLLAQFRLQAEHFISVLEVFYFCLELGYQGQYRLHEPVALLNLKRELRAQIQQVRGTQSRVLSPALAQNPTSVKNRTWFRRWQ